MPASTRDDDLGVTGGMTKRHQIHFPEPPDLPHRIPADDLGAASTFGAVRADHSSHSAPPRLCSPTKSRDLAQDETRARSNSVLGAPVNPSALPARTLGLCQYSHPNQSVPSPRAVGWAVWMCWAVWEHSGALVAFLGSVCDGQGTPARAVLSLQPMGSSPASAGRTGGKVAGKYCL